MIFSVPIAVIALVACGGIAAYITLYAWYRRLMPGALPISALAFCLQIWLFGYALELSSPNLNWALFWAAVEYLGIVCVPVVWLWFTAEYTGSLPWLRRRRLLVLLIMPMFTALFVWTNAWHGLIWSQVALTEERGLSILDVSRGGWFWIHTLYSYICLLSGAFFLIRFLRRSPGWFQGQAGAMLLAVVAPWGGNAIYLAGLSPFGSLDLTPFAFVVSLMAISWSIFRFRLFEIVPFARDLVVQSMSDAVMVLNEQRRVVDVNQAACRQIGNPASALIGKRASEVMAPWAEAVERYRDAIEVTDEIAIGEGATQRWFEVRISPIYDDRRLYRGRLVIWRDVSEQRRAQEAIRRTNEELLAAQAALIYARDQAESGSRAKSVFLSHMSHEFRTPLTAILGYTQLLMLGVGQQAPAETRADLEAIQTAGNHLLEMISNVLDISKIEAGRVDLKLETFSIPALLNEASRTVQPLLEQNQNRFIIDCAPELDSMHADLLKLRQILINLLGNAAKFTEHGTITLAAEPALHADTPGVRFRVVDTGPGIAPEHVAQLFTPFMRTEYAMARQKGAGLGLAISRHFARSMGGDLTVQSTVGQGTTFECWLPAIVCEEPRPAISE